MLKSSRLDCDCPHLRLKIVMGLLEKGYVNHQQVAASLGLSLEHWQNFYEHYQQGNIARIPESLCKVVPVRDWPFLAGFTDEQLTVLENAQRVPLLMSESIDKKHPLLQELEILLIFGVLLVGKHNQFDKYFFRVDW